MTPKILLVLAALLAGCAPVYVPNPVSTPLFDEQGDTEIAASVLQTGALLHAHLHVSTALTDKLGAMVNLSLANLGDTYEEFGVENDYSRHQLIEAGLGYYGRGQGTARYGLYAGAGYGGSDFNLGEDLFFSVANTQAEGRYARYFVQGHYGSSSSWIGACFAVRISLVDYKRYEINPAAIDVNSEVFLEPAFTLRLGPPEIHLFSQWLVLAPLTGSEEYDAPVFFPAVGVRTHLNQLY